LIKYAITDSKYYSFDYLKNLNNKADFVLLRDKTTKDYKSLAKDFINTTKDYSYKKILHQDYKLAQELGVYGVHLTSLQFKDIQKAKELNLFTIISTHSINEIKLAKELGANAVTFSPIFSTPNKGEPKGIKALKEAIECCNIKVIALGGIVTNNHIKQIATTNAWGFASIRYFV
jgi:thiamine-phosphate pyrophosphorylase